MRTPLNAIIGMSTIAQSTQEPEKIAQCLAKIQEASEHLLGMINDILDISKIEAGNFNLFNAEFNLPQTLNKIAGMQKFIVDAKKQTLLLEFDPALPETIVSDEQRLAQVLDNLLSNAVKFTPPEGAITLSVKKIMEKERTCTLEFTVKDNGIGISEEGLKKIFSLFEQVDGSFARRYGGTGMGLAISSNIVNLMGGAIKVDTEPGKGSSFSFEITVERGFEKTSDTEKESAKETGQKPKYEGKRIILAEDVEINREIVTSILEDSRLTIDCAENGLQALEKYKASNGNYDLILMDIHMPEMDGFEATRQIRAFEAEQCSSSKAKKPLRVPIIAMTANVFQDDVSKCLEAGMTDHLGKPIDFEELIKKLDALFL